MACVVGGTKDCMTVAEKNDCSIEGSPKESAPLEVCTIRFLLLDGNDFHLAFPPERTVLQLKEKIIADIPQAFLSFLNNSHLPTPTNSLDLRIFYFGKDLENDKTLQDYRFSPQEVSTVHLVVKIRTEQVVQSEKEEMKRQRACASCVIS
eukprot:jgi/Galph1/1163/GphlegSOOS_G5867.1